MSKLNNKGIPTLVIVTKNKCEYESYIEHHPNHEDIEKLKVDLNKNMPRGEGKSTSMRNEAFEGIAKWIKHHTKQNKKIKDILITFR